ncbi:trigger factor [Thermodesulfobacteriota bacterium]
MKATLEDVSSVKKRLMIEIEAEEIDKKVNKAYSKFGKTAKIKGFRPGKAPRKILENYFGDQVLEDVTNSIIKETLPKAMEETNTFPLNMPVVENELLKVGQSYKYSALMEVRPAFEIKDYLGIEVEKEECVVTEEDVERQLEEIRTAHGNLRSIEEDRGIKEGDYAIIDYEGFDGDTAIEDIKSQNYSLKIGNKQFYPGLEEALIGFKKGDSTEIKLDFEDDYFHSKLAGKSVNFRVSVTDIKEAELPELNDEFAKGLGGDFADLEGLKKKIREGLTKQKEEKIDHDLKNSLMEKISADVEFELPESLVEAEISSSVENIRQNITQAGSSLEKAGLDEAKLREEIKPTAEQRVKGMLILGEIAKQNSLITDENDINERFEEMSKDVGHDPGIMRRYYEANNLMDALRHTLLREKTLNYLVENAKMISPDADKVDDK